MEILALKIALLIAVTGTVVFIIDYTRLTKGGCWRDPVGLTLVIEALFALGYLGPLTLAAFFHLSVLGNEVGVWMLIVFIAAGGLVLYWRTLAFERVNPEKKQLRGKEPVKR